jgi:hypothetical protein
MALGVSVSTKTALHILMRLPSWRAAWPKNQSSETENLQHYQSKCSMKLPTNPLIQHTLDACGKYQSKTAYSKAK